MATGKGTRPVGNGGSMNQKARARRNRKITIFFIEIVIILAMIGILWVIMDKTEEAEGLIYTDTREIAPEELGISEVVQEQVQEAESPMAGYLNIALFGVDALSSSSKDLLKGYRSDSIMIASINLDTCDVKLVSVYRDTYLNLSNDTYTKCNTAYAKGGAQQAVAEYRLRHGVIHPHAVDLALRRIHTVVVGRHDPRIRFERFRRYLTRPRRG